jgi:hypothetical protein
MRHWCFAFALACGEQPTPEAPVAPSAPVDVVAEPVAVLGPSRGEVRTLIEQQTPQKARFLNGGWLRVGTHLGERVRKRACRGEVPRLGLAREGKGGRVHAFDGHHMVAYDILGIVSAGADAWTVWLAPVGAQRPVHTVQVTKLDATTTRWRSAAGAPDWADGADWVQESAASRLAEIEQLDCRPAPR